MKIAVVDNIQKCLGKTLYLGLILGIFFFSQSVLAQTLKDSNPESYWCYKTKGSLNIDGKLDESSWQDVEWSKAFVDIEGDKKPKPYFETKVKMLWDDEYLYIAAQLEETDVWATYDKRDMVIFHENDFEVFIDPDGDTHEYYEFEINALGTFWDLMLVKPYRDGGYGLNAWDIKGLKKGVFVDGTLNDGTDKDKSWTVELAFPWEVLKEAAPKESKPTAGDYWRIDFSRVHWRTEWKDGKYQKIINPETGKNYPEYNWVWSPQGVIAMHQPETWAYLAFSSEEAGTNKPEKVFEIPESENIKMFLRKLYYTQKENMDKKNKFISDKKALETAAKKSFDTSAYNYTLTAGDSWFRFSVKNGDELWVIREDGKVWNENQK
ncbi:carbohydrate-binding family 9-like protein [Chondrinema litorale]|uniref:carbohydrate-binding family 9-like protein n=1 Tax=Chondrinema litorale TaxID=2994555 RepID=UPI002543C104|nr:carbohydrate-binding family 9-like protein [Chondrinema litorale]UZR99875.1 carbohydrate-binding family 9-like protein [Chondrinema litorale]